MKLENKINYNDIKKAVKLWACRMDGYDGAIGGIIGEIPWTGEVESVIHWDDVDEAFSDLIPNCPNIDPKKVVSGDEDTMEKLETLAAEVAGGICEFYSNLITDVNKKFQKVVVIRKFIRVNHKGICEYEIHDKLYGDTWAGVFTKAYNLYVGNTNSWEYKSFLDACFQALYSKNMSVSLAPKLDLGFSEGD